MYLHNIFKAILIFVILQTTCVMAGQLEGVPKETVASFVQQCYPGAEITVEDYGRAHDDVKLFLATANNHELVVKVKNNDNTDKHKNYRWVVEELNTAKNVLTIIANNHTKLPIIVPDKYGFLDTANNSFIEIGNVLDFDHKKYHQYQHASESLVCLQLMKKAHGHYPGNKSLRLKLELAAACGRALGLLHKHGIRHGDLANYNNMFYDGKKITFIDISSNPRRFDAQKIWHEVGHMLNNVQRSYADYRLPAMRALVAKTGIFLKAYRKAYDNPLEIDVSQLLFKLVTKTFFHSLQRCQLSQAVLVLSTENLPEFDYNTYILVQPVARAASYQVLFYDYDKQKVFEIKPLPGKAKAFDHFIERLADQLRHVKHHADFMHRAQEQEISQYSGHVIHHKYRQKILAEIYKDIMPVLKRYIEETGFASKIAIQEFIQTWQDSNPYSKDDLFNFCMVALPYSEYSEQEIRQLLQECIPRLLKTEDVGHSERLMLEWLLNYY